MVVCDLSAAVRKPVWTLGIPSSRCTPKSLRGGSAAGAGRDLLEIYRGLRPDLLVVDGADDEHPNEIAHRLASRAIVKALEETLRTRSNSDKPN